MSFTRALAPFRRAHFLRPRAANSFERIFERDPFFAGLAPIINSEFGQFQRFNFPRVDIREGPKAYRLEAEIPGFRKNDLSIEVLDNRTLRIAGKRQLSKNAEAEGAEEAAGSDNIIDSANTIESREPTSAETSENVEASTPANAEASERDVENFQSEEDYELIETERDQEITFSRQLRLPGKIDQDGIKASLDHGILSVVLPKLKEEAGRKVTIE